MTVRPISQASATIAQRLADVLSHLERIVVGKPEVLKLALTCLLARGHLLIEDIPGVGKSTLAQALAAVLGLRYARVQFTSDLLPADVLGVSVFDSVAQAFRFHPGPIFTSVLLADEINRAPPKTQSALLEAMQERQVTVGQKTWPLPRPFFVIATQNPIEQEGTYPLPEAQLDRFLFAIHVAYPSAAEEERILMMPTGAVAGQVPRLLEADRIRALQELVLAIPVSRYVVAYTAKLVRATRPGEADAPDFVREMVDWGAGPRAGQHLILAGKALAAMAGRAAVSLDDVRAAAVPVLRHRVATNFAAETAGLDPVAIIRRLIEVVPEPPVRQFEPASGARV